MKTLAIHKRATVTLALAVASVTALAVGSGGVAHAAPQQAVRGSVTLTITPEGPDLYRVRITGTPPSPLVSTYRYSLYGDDGYRIQHRYGPVGPYTTDYSGFTHEFLVSGDVLDEDAGFAVDEIIAMVTFQTPPPARTIRSNMVMGTY
jgi:hypothetical protein